MLGEGLPYGKKITRFLEKILIRSLYQCWHLQTFKRYEAKLTSNDKEKQNIAKWKMSKTIEKEKKQGKQNMLLRPVGKEKVRKKQSQIICLRKTRIENCDFIYEEQERERGGGAITAYVIGY